MAVSMESDNNKVEAAHTKITLNVGFYDPFSVFQGGFRSDFQKHVEIPSFYWKDSRDFLRVLKNVELNFLEETPRVKAKDLTYLKFMFISCQSIEEYRATVRPLIKQWIDGLNSTSPKVPFFIIFFENTEQKSATDKYLKTNLINKIKSDFENHAFRVENIFKIKSMYPTSDDRVNAWKSVTSSLKALLADSINAKLVYYESDPIKTARVFQHLKQYEDSLACFYRLFNSLPCISKGDIDEHDLSTFLSTLSTDFFSEELAKSTLLTKTWYFAQQRQILTDPRVTDLVYLKNLTRLGQTLLSFLNSLELCYKRCEISFIMIENFMKNPRMWKVIEKTNSSHTDIISCIGKLKILQRSDLVMLGTSRGYYIEGSMTLVNVELSQKEEYKTIDEELNRALHSKQALTDMVIQLTRNVIEIYDQSGINNSTIAILSTELALILYYSTEDYEVSCNQLMKSYEYFLANGWHYIGVRLLEVYIENLDKLVEKHGSDVILQLLTSYINLASNGSCKFDENKFRSLCLQLQEKKILKLNDLFLLSHISTVYCDELETYKLKIQLRSKIQCKVDSVKLDFRNKDNDILEFSSGTVDITTEKVMVLKCTKVVFDDFKSTNLKITIGKLEILQPVTAKIHVLPIKTFVKPSSGELVENAAANMSIPRTRYLHTDQLVLSVKAGKACLENPELLFMKTDPDKLNPSANYQMTVYDNNTETAIEFIVEESQKYITFRMKSSHELQPGSTLAVKIPYYFPPDVSNTVLNLHYKVKYHAVTSETTDPIECTRKYFSQIDSSLPLAVAAEEVFHSTNEGSTSKTPTFSIFSRLTINSISSDEPIRIQKVTLDTQDSEVETWKAPKDIIAFFDQGTTFFFKITDFGTEDVTLKIEYNTIRDEIVEYLEGAFSLFVSEHHPRITNNEDIHTFNSLTREIWKSIGFKLNLYALAGKAFMLDPEARDLHAFLRYFDPSTRSMYEEALLEFLDSLRTLRTSNMTNATIRSETKQNLIITVKLPQINIVNIVEYKFDKELQYRVCEPIKVTVQLSVHLVKLTSDQIEEFGGNSAAGKKVRFQSKDNETDDIKHILLELEMVDPDQKWIISGMRYLEANILLSELLDRKSSIFCFDLTLVPLKLGKLQLPSLSVRNKNYKDLVMELDYKNAAESLLVVSELNKIIHSF